MADLPSYGIPTYGAPANIAPYSQGVFGGSSDMGLPLLAATGIGAALNFFGQRSQQKAQEKMNQLQMAEQESQMNPFRGVLAQGGALQRLDRATGTTPRSVVTQPNGYSAIQGGQYTMSPELMQWLASIKQDVASGQGRNPLISPQAKVSVMDLNTNQHAGPGPWR